MEYIFVSQLMKHLESTSILTENQFGFREHHSCEPQLLVTVDDIAKAINNKLQVDLAVLDFSKAFGKVAYARLLNKREYYEVRASLLEWFEYFLHNRTQQVIIEGHYSISCDISVDKDYFLLLIPTPPDLMDSNFTKIASTLLLEVIVFHRESSMIGTPYPMKLYLHLMY